MTTDRIYYRKHRKDRVKFEIINIAEETISLKVYSIQNSIHLFYI